MFFQMEGMMRVILEPLIGDAPLVGGVTFFFIRRPVSARCISTGIRHHCLSQHNTCVFDYLEDAGDQLDWCDQPP